MTDQSDPVMPTGCVVDYAGSSAPAGWLFCDGSAVSRTNYAALFAAISTTFGAGDGSTTFNLPDARGRVTAGKDNMGGSAANRLTTGGSGVNGTNLGAAGGAETQTLSLAQIPSHTHTVGTVISGRNTSSGGGESIMYSGVSTSSGTAGSGTAHNNTQPTIVFNKIIRT